MKQFEQVRGKLIDMLEDLDLSLGQIAEEPTAIDSNKIGDEANKANNIRSSNVASMPNSKNSHQNQHNRTKGHCTLCGKSIDILVTVNQSGMHTCKECKKILHGD